MELLRESLGLIAFIAIVAVVMYFVVIGAQHNHFQRAIAKMASTDSLPDVSAVMDIYLGVCEKRKANYNARDQRRLEKWFAFSIPTLATGTNDAKVTLRTEQIAHLRKLLSDLRSMK